MAPIFVGPTDDDSKIRDNRIGFAISTANPGTASEGDIYFNSTDKQLRGYDGSAWAAIGGGGGGTAEFTVSGSLSDGQTVILKSDGNVAGITTSQITQGLGSLTRFEDGYTNRVSSAYDSNSGRLVIVYSDEGDSDKGKAIVGTVDADNSTITFGTPVVFKSTVTDYTNVTFDSNANKFLVAYQQSGGVQYGQARVGTVDPSDNSISFGTEVQFVSEASDIVGTFDSSNNKIVLAYRNNNNYGDAIVATISGTDVSFGSVVQFQNSDSRNPDITFDSTNNKVVIAWRHLNNSHYGTAIVGTVSGNSISFGSAVVFESARSEYIKLAFDPDNGKVLVAYRDAGNSNKGTYIVGTVSGTSISFGTAGYFENANSDHIGLGYDENVNKFVIAYGDVGNSDAYTINNGTLSGTTVTWGTPQLVTGATSGRGTLSSVVYASDVKRITVAYRNNAVSGVGSAFVYRNAYVDTTLTSTNFLGFSDAAYTNGQSATIQMVGAVDDAQTGLTTATKHFVQKDGSLGTTADTPSVFAGTAISGTKIIVRK